MVCYAISPGVFNAGSTKYKEATLVLNDGTRFQGYLFGAQVPADGEVGNNNQSIFSSS